MPFETDKESSTMRSSLAEDGSKPETKLATFKDPPKQEALVAAAKSGEELAFEALLSSDTSQGFSRSRCATHASRRTQKTLSSKLSKKPSSTCTNSKGNLLLHLVDAHRHQRGTYVASERSRAARGTHRRFEQRRNSPWPGGARHKSRLRSQILTAGRGANFGGRDDAVEVRNSESPRVPGTP